MITWSHYQFQQRLKQKSKHYYKCHVVEVTEEWTSKTWVCGAVDMTLGGKQIYKCKGEVKGNENNEQLSLSPCGYQLDRDCHGSRNILWKSLDERHSSMSL